MIFIFAAHFLTLLDYYIYIIYIINMYDVQGLNKVLKVSPESLNR